MQRRLRTLAPFIQWDHDAVPLTSDGRVVFVVEGYTTSDTYPYAESVDLGGEPANYARASVRATVDAFTGRIELYRTDTADPVARAWAEIFPDLFRPEADLPAQLDRRLRYPWDLFEAQSTAYERFHTTRPDVFVSEAEAWARPLALSGPIEVAGDVDFDESDEDDLRLTLQPGYKVAAPPGQETERLVLETYYSPRGAQNLVSSLSGWIDERGRVRLSSRSLPTQPVTLGPAQMSRLAFATTRVRNLLGIRNLEIRDLAASSLDTVLLGRPRLLFLPTGVLQLQSLYEGSRGPGAARLIGVTAFLEGRVGLGPDVESAVRQALNEPPELEILPPEGPVVVGRPVELAFRVENARREDVTIRSPGGRQVARRDLATGRGSVRFVPTAAGEASFRVAVSGLDGTRVADSTTFEVVHPPPRIRLGPAPGRIKVGQLVEVPFKVVNGVHASVRVSTGSGIVFDRRFLLREPSAVATWVPRDAGKAVLLVRARGPGGRTVKETLRLTVAPRPQAPPSPSVELIHVPGTLTVERPSRFVVQGDGCRSTVVQVEARATEPRTWRFPCPARRVTFTWTPTEAGRYHLAATARAGDTTARVTARLKVQDR